MTQIDYIKHLRDIEGASISEIAARVKCDWKTAKKYADGNIDLRRRGQEKGHVENKVGYVRRNNFSPPPIIDDLDEFNRNLNRAMIADRERKHYSKGALISELWEDDLKNLLPLPEMPMDIFQLFTRTVNKYGEVRVDDQLYRVPNAAPGRRVLIKACWDQLEILDKDGERVLHTVKRVYFQKAENIDWAAELEIFINRPRAAERAVYLTALPDTLKTYILSAPDLKERRQRIMAAVTVLRQYPLGVAVKAAKQALDYGRTDINSLRMFAALQAGASTPTPSPIEEPWTPSEVAQWQPDLSIYDLLGVTGHAK